MKLSLIVLIVAPLLSSAINTHNQVLHMNSHPSSIDQGQHGPRWYTKEGPGSSYVNKRNTPVRQGKAYEDDVIPGDSAEEPETVDLHSGEFCVDVSTFGPVEYDIAPVEVCDSTFAKQCEDRYEEVCDDVTEMVCEIVPYTECEMLMESVPYKSFEVVQKLTKKKVCTAGMDIVKHTKMMPECRNVTKQNCITKWETDENGKQVWAGNEACEPVTWRECKLVPKQVDFKVPKITCDDGEDIAYDDYLDTEKNQMTSRMVCEVKHATSCEPKVTNKCQNIAFQECNEIPTEKCETKDVKIPKQEKEHKKKCLLADDNALPAGASSTPAPAPQSYPTPSPSPSYTNQPSVDTNVIRQPAPAAPQPTYPAAPKPTYQATAQPQSSYGVPRAGRLTSQNFGQRQPVTQSVTTNNNQFNRRPKSSFRQQQNNQFQNFNGRFQG